MLTGWLIRPVLCLACSSGYVEVRDHVDWPDPDYKLARYAVATAEFLRPVSSHVPGPDSRRRRDEIGWILGELCDALDLNVCERRLLKVHADRDTRVTGQRAAFAGVLARAEHQVAPLDHEPHRRNQRTAVGGAVAELACPRPFQEERANLFVIQRVHARKCRPLPSPESCQAARAATHRVRWPQHDGRPVTALATPRGRGQVVTGSDRRPV